LDTTSTAERSQSSAKKTWELVALKVTDLATALLPVRFRIGFSGCWEEDGTGIMVDASSMKWRKME
jgi:hypothetical protein